MPFLCKGCICCKCLLPRYKRLVDNVYPRTQGDPVGNEVEKLEFFASSSSEKMDRIGEYIYQKVRYDLSKGKTEYVIISLEVMEKLLKISEKSKTLNLFVESYIEVIEEVIATDNFELQKLAADKFYRFAKDIKEDETATYYRRYDTIIAQCSYMCLKLEEDPIKRRALRLAGIKGIAGVIMKTDVDALDAHFWEEDQLEQIVNALLHVMDSSDYCLHCGIVYQYENQDDPGVMAESCLELLVHKVSFVKINMLLRPILRYFDEKNLWKEHQFSTNLFNKILPGVQLKYTCTVSEFLIKHLDDRLNEPTEILNGILNVVCQSINISCKEKLCTNLCEIVMLLIQHLKNYLSLKEYTKDYPKAVGACILGSVSHLPDDQKLEVTVFLLSNVPNDSDTELDLLFQKTILGSVLSIAKSVDSEKFDMRHLFSPPLMNQLLRLFTNISVCSLVQGIVQALLDRHGNLEYLYEPRLDVPGLKSFVCLVADVEFISEHGEEIYKKILEALSFPSNTNKSYSAFYKTLALIAIEITTPSTATEYLTTICNIQEIALTQSNLTMEQKSFLHSICITLLSLISSVLQVKSLLNYCTQIIELRKKQAPYLLPNYMMTELSSINNDIELFLDLSTLEELLQNSGLDSNRANWTQSYRYLWIDEAGSLLPKEIAIDLNEKDFDSAMEFFSNKHLDTRIRFEAMKSTLCDLSESKKRKLDKANKQKELANIFRTKSFTEIKMAHTTEDCLQTKLKSFLEEPSSEIKECTVIFNEELYPEIFREYHEAK